MIVVRMCKRLCDYAGTRNKTEKVKEVGVGGRENQERGKRRYSERERSIAAEHQRKRNTKRRDLDQDRHMTTRMRSGCDH